MSEFQKSVVTALAQYMAAAVPDLVQVIPEWPGANITLKYPSMTVTTSGNVNFTPMMGTEIEQSEMDIDNQATVLYFAGHFEPRFQLDLWTQSKPQRSKLFEKIINALNPDPLVTGIRILLPDYYGQWASYVLTGYELPDGPESAQRQEWRCILSVTATCNAIFDRREYIIANAILADEPTANYNEEF